MEAIRKITAHIWQTCGLPIDCEAQRRTSNWRSWEKKLAQLRFQWINAKVISDKDSSLARVGSCNGAVPLALVASIAIQGLEIID
ncbi:hypothetical protein J3E68DRAFT_105621 [Trichoderma sp. SZMC 28012]